MCPDETSPGIADPGPDVLDDLHRVLFEQATDAILCVGADGRFEAINQRGCEILGYSRDELLGRTALEFLFPGELDRQPVRWDELRAGRTLLSQRVVRAKDGRPITVELSAKMLPEGRLLVVGRDISAYERARVASEDKFSKAFHTNPAPMAISTVSEGRFVDVNEAFVKATGYAREEVIGRTGPELGLFPILAQREEAGRLLVEEGSFQAFEAAVRRKDGRTLDGLFGGAAIEVDGQRLLLTTMLDITERKRAEAVTRLEIQRMETLLRLNQMERASLGEITDFALGEAVRLTGSRIGYLAFLSEDGSVLTLHSWSKEVLAGGQTPHSPTCRVAETTGPWAEAVRQRAPVICNDYRAPEDGQGGYPDGHVAVTRHMNVPVRAGERIVAVAGVGNKETPYDEGDVAELTLLMEALWRLIERKQAEEALRQSEDRFSKAFRSSPFPMSITRLRDGLYMDVNDVLCATLEYDRSEFVGRNAVELGIWPDPGDRQRLLELLARDGSVHDQRFRFRTKSGRVITTRYSGEIIDVAREPHIMSVLVDVTEREEVEEALRQKTEQLEHYFANSLDLLCIMGLDGRFRRLNPEWSRTLGYRLEELEGRPLLDFVHPDDRAATLALMTHLAEQQAIPGFVNRFRTKDGSYRWVEWRAHSAGGLAYAAARDITARKRDEEERLELERHLLHSQKLESLGVLAGGIAHDFNNLLMAMMGNLELALRKLPAASPVRLRVEQAVRAAARAADLTRQMLAYSGRGRFVVGKVDLSQLVEENANLLRSSVARTTTLDLRTESLLPLINADAGQLQQVVMNLITNASEAIGGQPGTITLATGAMECDARYLSRSRLAEKPEPGLFAYVEVTDTGCGMDTETQQRMFDPFYSTKATGRGLGMSSVLGITRGHGGAILLDSEVGGGSRIRVLFPVAEERASAEAVKLDDLADIGPMQRPTGHRGTVLVVDDEKLIRDLAAQMVQDLGFSALTAEDGQQAVDLVRAGTVDFRIILLDLSMPVMDGPTALREILRIRPDARIILSSGYDERDADVELVREGRVGFISKPYGLGGLREALDRALATPD